MYPLYQIFGRISICQGSPACRYKEFFWAAEHFIDTACKTCDQTDERPLREREAPPPEVRAFWQFS